MEKQRHFQVLRRRGSTWSGRPVQGGERSAPRGHPRLPAQGKARPGRVPACEEPGDAPKGDLADSGQVVRQVWSRRRVAEITVTFKGNTVTVDAVTPEGGADRDQGGGPASSRSARPHRAIDWLKFATDTGDGLPDRQGIYIFGGRNALKTTTRRRRRCAARARSTAARPARSPSSSGPRRSTTSASVTNPSKRKTPRRPQGRPRQLQGTWSAKVGPEKEHPESPITIKGNAVTLKITPADGKNTRANGELRVDETAKPYKTDRLVEIHQPERRSPTDNLGLYELTDADTLPFVAGAPATIGRPSSRPAKGARPTSSCLPGRPSRSDDGGPIVGRRAREQKTFRGRGGVSTPAPLFWT